MCQRHRDQIIPDVSPFGQIFDAVLNGKPIPQDAWKTGAIRAFEAMIGRPLTTAERAAIENGDFTYVGGGSSSSRSSRGSGARADARARPHEDSARRQKEALERERARQIGHARKTLGFTAKEAITAELVKQRFRELAKKHHPDRFATDPVKHAQATKRMAEINHAYEVLTRPAA